MRAGRRFVRACLVAVASFALLLAPSCNGGDGEGVFQATVTFVPDRAPLDGEFFLLPGPVHDSKLDLELHVRWPAGKGSLAAVILQLELPPGYSLADARLADGWPPWEGAPEVLVSTAPWQGNRWLFGLAPGIVQDDDGNQCLPFPEPVDGDLHLGTLTVEAATLRPGRVGLAGYEEDGAVSWYCREAGLGFALYGLSGVGGSIQ